MKASAAAAILLATATRAGAFPSFLRSHRALINQQCLDETDSYIEDSLMVAAYGAVEEEIEDEAACSDTVLGKTSCQVDFSTFDSYSNLQNYLHRFIHEC